MMATAANAQSALAVCKVNVGISDEGVKGRTDFMQRERLSGELSPVYITTNWLDLKPFEQYQLSILGDTADDCAGDFLIAQLLA